MNFNQLAKVMPSILDIGHSIELISPPGRGKSEFVKELIASSALRTGKSWGFATCFLATMTPSDLLGYMVPGVDTKGRRRSEFTAPPWMYTAEGAMVEDFERGILFLDEYGQGESDVKRASAELLLNRKLGPWQLPKGWSVIAASNRAKDRSGVTKSFDFVINRRQEVHIDDDYQSWEDWAVKHGVDPLLITFTHENPDVVFSPEPPKDQGPWCTPRSLVHAGEQLVAMRTEGGNLPDNDIAIELTSGWIGSAAAQQLFATVRLANEMPKFEDICADPDHVFLPARVDAMLLVAYTLASRTKHENCDAVVRYVKRMPEEFLVLWVKATAQYNLELVRHPAFSALYMANAALFNSVISSQAR